VSAAEVGDGFPFAGGAGVEVAEEAVGVDFGGGVPWGVVGGWVLGGGEGGE